MMMVVWDLEVRLDVVHEPTRVFRHNHDSLLKM
jgi:hypothetical protein